MVECFGVPPGASKKVLRALLSTNTEVLDPSLMCTVACTFIPATLTDRQQLQDRSADILERENALPEVTKK